jgi:hypothetical protein
MTKEKQQDPLKIYEVETQADGSVKVTTEFTPEEVKSLLTLALTMCLSQGLAPASIAHLFQPTEDKEEIDLGEIPTERFYNA